MAATSPDRSRKKPADAACAPEGATYVATGTFDCRIAELIARLQPANLDLAVRIAGIPEEVRGFDTVKDAAMDAAMAKAAELLAVLRDTAVAANAGVRS